MKTKILKIITCFTLALAVVLSCVPLTAYATETTSTKKYVYNFTVTKTTNTYDSTLSSTTSKDKAEEIKYDVRLESDYPCVAVNTYTVNNIFGQPLGFTKGYSDKRVIKFYTLNASESVETAPKLSVVRQYTYDHDAKTWQAVETTTSSLSSTSLDLAQYYFEFKNSGLKCLYFADSETVYDANGNVTSNSIDVTQNVQSYLLTGKLAKTIDGTSAYALSNTSKIQIGKTMSYAQGREDVWAYGPTLNNVKISDDGIITWDTPITSEACIYKGISVIFYSSSNSNAYVWNRTVPMDYTLQVNIPKDSKINSIALLPYYVTVSGRFLPFSNAPKISTNVNASYYQGDGTQPLITIGARQDSTPSGVIPDTDFDGGSGENDDSDSDISSDGADEIGAPSEAEMKSFLDSTGKVGSLGYLQGVTYKEENHTLSSRTATISWSTSKEIPNARIQIASRNLYGTWTSQKIGMYVYKDYNDGVKYSTGSITFTAQDACEKWCKQNNYDISLTSLTHRTHYTTDYYIRAVVYDETTGQYNYGGWVRIDVKQANSTQLAWTNTETGKWDDETGKWESDTESDDSYSYETGSDGTVMDDVLNMDNINLNAFTWLWGNVKNVVSTLGDFPFLISSVFGFIPSEVIGLISVLLGVTVLLRFVGR